MRRRVMAALAALVLAVAAWLQPVRASAQTNDQVDSLKQDYTVSADGTVHVNETWVYRFGDNSGRHGITRTLLTREPNGKNSDEDVVYTIDNLKVSSPDASAKFTTQEAATSGDPRERYLTITIGDRNRTITSDTATYQLSYDITGALRSPDDKPEFAWDMLNDLTPDVHNISVTINVPGGAQAAKCVSGPVGSQDSCTSTSVDNGVASFTQALKPRGEIMTAAVQITPGLVSNATPHLVPKAKSPVEQGLQTAGVSAGVTTLAGALYLIVLGRKRRDERFAGLPPGTVPTSGQAEAAPVAAASRQDVIPVRFSPPEVPVALGGLLIDGAIGARETSATLVDLAVRGALQLSSDPSSTKSNPKLTARLVDPSKATEPFERTMLVDVFGPGEVSRPSGAEVNLSKPGVLTKASDELSYRVSRIALGEGLMKHVGPVGGTAAGASPASIAKLAWIGVVLAVLLLPTSVGIASLFASPLVAVGIGIVLPLLGILVVRHLITRRGQRTAVGRALTDQVDGFYKYLNTAEADQIRFEEGEDIFSRYLPWAIAFGIADRWAKVCQQLVDMGRLPATAPTWYYGDPYAFSYGFFAGSALNSMQTGVMPQPPAASSGSGFDSGSSFFSGGGGFAGGGGGGGGVGSW
ncbi:Predicted membrane protein [Propionibacterium cyclohexanicum]|uniref:Predicted membrane protein n=1 Tax=Propionibacterium cyclohexanicum TaxID=64702 RepID=A0A1H9R7Y7_9ACTN|nr:DUF2207 domain-containing protein [Propionibacterium cyclohexanicum]SER68707.1 Predicted membrane protein [Propionibacterium cyclohexanicum]